MSDESGEDPPERKFLTSRNKVKTGEALFAAVAKNPPLISKEEREIYYAAAERDKAVDYEIVVRRGELYNMDPESSTNPVQINQQLSKEDMHELRSKCTQKQFVEVVRLLPEFNFSKEEVIRHVKSRSKNPLLFECGVQGCLRQQQRWHARLLHGCYPQDDMREFQHDRTDTMPSCYFVNKKENKLNSDKYLDVLSDFEDVDHHRTGRERKRNFKKKRYSVDTPPAKRSLSK